MAPYFAISMGAHSSQWLVSFHEPAAQGGVPPAPPLSRPAQLNDAGAGRGQPRTGSCHGPGSITVVWRGRSTSRRIVIWYIVSFRQDHTGRPILLILDVSDPCGS